MKKKLLSSIILALLFTVTSCSEKKAEKVEGPDKGGPIYYENYHEQIALISNYLNYQMAHYPSSPEDSIDPSIEDMIDDPEGIMELAGNGQPLIVVDTFKIVNPRYIDNTKEFHFDIVFPKSYLCTVELELVENNPNYTQVLVVKDNRILIRDNLLVPTGKAHFVNFINTELKLEFDEATLKRVSDVILKNL